MSAACADSQKKMEAAMYSAPYAFAWLGAAYPFRLASLYFGDHRPIAEWWRLCDQVCDSFKVQPGVRRVEQF